MQLLNPFEVDDRRHADKKVDVPGYVRVLGDDRSVQPLIKEEIGFPGQVFPSGERAGRLAVARRLRFIVQIATEFPAAAFPIRAKQVFELGEQIRIRPEVAEMVIAAIQGLSHLQLHLRAVVAMQAVSLDEGGFHLLPAKYLLEGAHDRGRAGSGGTCDSNDRVPGGHGRLTS